MAGDPGTSRQRTGSPTPGAAPPTGGRDDRTACMCSRAAAVGIGADPPPPASTHRRSPGRTEEPRGRPPVHPQQQGRPPVPPGCVEVRGDDDGAYLTCGQLDYVATELLWVGYRGERTLAVHNRLYPQVRQLIRDLLEELGSELAELDPRLTLTSIND